MKPLRVRRCALCTEYSKKYYCKEDKWSKTHVIDVPVVVTDRAENLGLRVPSINVAHRAGDAAGQ